MIHTKHRNGYLLGLLVWLIIGTLFWLTGIQKHDNPRQPGKTPEVIDRP